MALAYTELITTGANLLADLRTAILASSDWTRPNAGGKPDTYKAVNSAGVQMVVDLADVAPANNSLNLAFYDAYDGVTFGNKAQRFLWWSSQNGAFATKVLRCTVSLSSEHFFLAIEGARAGEAGADNATWGSIRNYFYVDTLVPYFTAPIDNAPTVVVGGNLMNVADQNPNVNLAHRCQVAKSVAGVSAYGNGILHTLQWPETSDASSVTVQRIGPDGKFYLFPYVFFDNTSGIRGRLASIFNAGQASPDNSVDQNPAAPVGQLVTYNGKNYKIMAANKGNSQAGSRVGGSLGGNVIYATITSVLIAVPCV